MSRVSAPTLPRSPASPAATRPSRPGWRDPRLAVGIGLVALCGLLGARLLGGADDTVQVWAVQGDRVAGQSLTEADLAAVRIHFDSVGDADRYLSAADPVPDGALFTRDVGAGELLPRAALGSAEGVDLVELPVTLPSQAVPATLREGATIDIWVTPKDSLQSDLVLEGVRVLALPVAEDSLSPSSDRQVIVGLDRAQQDELPSSLAKLASGSVVVTSRAGR
jgi:hypothetical protein